MKNRKIRRNSDRRHLARKVAVTLTAVTVVVGYNSSESIARQKSTNVWSADHRIRQTTENETQRETKTGSEIMEETEAERMTESEANTEPETMFEPEVKTEPETTAEPEAKTEPDAMKETGAVQDTKLEPGNTMETETDLKSEPESEVEPESGTKPETEMETETETNKETETESRNETEGAFVTEQETEIIMEYEGETETDTEGMTENEPETRTGAVPESETETETKAVSESETETETGAVPESETETVTKTIPESETRKETETVSEKRTETETETTAVQESEIEAETGAVPESETETETGTIPESEIEAETGTVSEDETVTEAVSESETGTEAIPENETETEAIPENETETEAVWESETGTEAIPENETETEIVSESETGTEAVPESETGTGAGPECQTENGTVQDREVETEAAEVTLKQTESETESDPETEAVTETESVIETETVTETEPVIEIEPDTETGIGSETSAKGETGVMPEEDTQIISKMIEVIPLGPDPMETEPNLSGPVPASDDQTGEGPVPVSNEETEIEPVPASDDQTGAEPVTASDKETWIELAVTVSQDPVSETEEPDLEAPVIEVGSLPVTIGHKETSGIELRLKEEHPGKDAVRVALSGPKGETKVIPKAIPAGEGEIQYTIDLAETGLEEDGLYTLKIEAEDEAGNFTRIQEDITVNRTGSVYTMAERTMKAMDTYYHRDSFDVVIEEKNLSEIETVQLICNVNGRSRLLKEGEEFDTCLKEEADGYKRYTYTIHSSAFQEEGAYEILVATGDSAGNQTDTLSQDAAMRFMVDRSIPECFITGLEEQEVIYEDGLVFTAEPRDNLALDQMELYVNRDPVYIAEEDELMENGGIVRWKLEPGQDWQQVQVHVTDKSGNEYWTREIPVFVAGKDAQEPIPEYRSIGRTARQIYEAKGGVWQTGTIYSKVSNEQMSKKPYRSAELPENEEGLSWGGISGDLPLAYASVILVFFSAIYLLLFLTIMLL